MLPEFIVESRIFHRSGSMQEAGQAVIGALQEADTYGGVLHQAYLHLCAIVFERLCRAERRGDDHGGRAGIAGSRCHTLERGRGTITCRARYTGVAATGCGRGNIGAYGITVTIATVDLFTNRSCCKFVRPSSNLTRPLRCSITVS